MIIGALIGLFLGLNHSLYNLSGQYNRVRLLKDRGQNASVDVHYFAIVLKQLNFACGGAIIGHFVG